MLDIMVSPVERGYLTDQDQTWRKVAQAALSEQNEKELLTSGETCTTSNKSLQRRTADILKKKLTARVLPMTRNTGMNGDNKSNALTETTDKADDVCRSTSCATNPLLPASIASSLKLKDELKCSKDTISKAIKPRSSKKEQGKKRRAIKHEDKELETSVKRTKLILPAPALKECKLEPGIGPSSCGSRTLSASSASQLQGQMSPEPRLMSENLATMSLLSASECHLATLQDEDGDTPLHIAIAQNNLGLTGYLIQLMSLAGLKVDIYNNLKQTPLHLAVITQQFLIVRALLGAGANVNLPDRNGQTALHLACQRSDLPCLQELLHAQNPEIADCEAGNFDGFKPLHLAVFVGSVELINCLVDNGADINCKDGKSGRAPLHHAVETDNLAVIGSLVRLGAKVNVHALSGCTPLQIASGRGMDSITKILSGNTAEDGAQKQNSSWHPTVTDQTTIRSLHRSNNPDGEQER